MTDTSNFRAHLPDLNTPRFVSAAQQDIHSYTDTFWRTKHPPWLYDLSKVWETLLAEPFRGLTNDGQIREGLFQRQGEDVSVEETISKAQELLRILSPSQRDMVSYEVNAREWRAWSNPEFLLRPFGLRLEELPGSVVEAILVILEKSMSPQGYQKALTIMHTNHFLGEICQLPKILNQHSYNFLMFGSPSKASAWGWSLYGHHLCLSAFFIGTQIVISPTFAGAEPTIIDSGPWSGSQTFHVEETLGLKLMQSLPSSVQKQAQIFVNLLDEGMNLTGDLATDRWNKDDQRQVCGAFRDNRIVPYEGICVSSFSRDQKGILLQILDEFVIYLPNTARNKRLEQIEAYFDETYFCWIGGFGDYDPFYYRIQSPVIVCEFDHHSGVFLANKEPAKFHIHTIMRTPNGGDYGNALRHPQDKLA